VPDDALGVRLISIAEDEQLGASGIHAGEALGDDLGCEREVLQEAPELCCLGDRQARGGACLRNSGGYRLPDTHASVRA